MTIITSMRMLISDGYLSNKVEKSLQKVLKIFFQFSEKNPETLFNHIILHFKECAFHEKCF